MENKYNKDVTILSTFQIRPEKTMWKECIRSYYQTMVPPYPLHLIQDDSTPSYHEELCKVLDELGANYKFIKSEYPGAFGAVYSLIKEVKTKYFFFIIDDVIMVKDKDIITPLVHFMEENKEVIQIKLGGGPISEGPSNKYWVIDKPGGNRTLNVPGNPVLHPTKTIGNNTIWTFSLIPENTRGQYPLPWYNGFLRTSIFHKINDIIINLYKNDQNTARQRLRHHYHRWSHYIAYTQYYHVDTLPTLYKLGWPPKFEFLSNYKTGWLNMCNYIYCLHNRCESPLHKFKITHTQELT
jgi:hypothetical protein